VKFVSMDGIDEQSEFEDHSMHEIIPDDSCIPALDALERKEVLSLLAQRMAGLPDMPKKVWRCTITRICASPKLQPASD
jgi:hypothetical protein